MKAREESMRRQKERNVRDGSMRGQHAASLRDRSIRGKHATSIKTAKPGAIRREGLVAYVQLRGWMWVEVRVRGRNKSAKK